VIIAPSLCSTTYATIKQREITVNRNAANLISFATKVAHGSRLPAPRPVESISDAQIMACFEDTIRKAAHWQTLALDISEAAVPGVR
jgi:hypothetical protein